MSEVVQRWEMPIRNEDDVILVRRKARTLAQETMARVRSAVKLEYR